MAILAFDGETYGGSNIVYEVVEFDDIPIIISPGNQNVTSGQGFSLSITASDEESDPLNFTITSNGTLTLLPTSNFSANVSFALGYPTSLDAGLYNVSIVAWQASNPMKNATTTFTVLVTEPNNASVFTSTPAVNGTQGTLFEYIILANDTNPADQLFFSVASPGCSITNPWSVNTTSNSSTGAIGIINVTLTNNHIICRSVRLSVSDYTAAGVFRSTTSYNITFNLTNTNDVPIIAEISAEKQFAANFRRQ